jgi:hypothetical protein
MYRQVLHCSSVENDGTCYAKPRDKEESFSLPEVPNVCLNRPIICIISLLLQLFLD